MFFFLLRTCLNLLQWIVKWWTRTATMIQITLLSALHLLDIFSDWYNNTSCTVTFCNIQAMNGKARTNSFVCMKILCCHSYFRVQDNQSSYLYGIGHWSLPIGQGNHPWLAIPTCFVFLLIFCISINEKCRPWPWEIFPSRWNLYIHIQLRRWIVFLKC